MVNILKIAQLGSPVIRQKAKPVNNVESRIIQKLIDQMIVTCNQVNGVGIAAPQVSRSLRIFIVASHPNKRYPHAPKMKPEAMINPRILQKSKELKKDWEGCLSIPGIRALVPRHKSLKVQYTQRNGRTKKAELSGFIARIFQHELDHLNGIVFMDRAKSKDIITEKEYQKIITKKI